MTSMPAYARMLCVVAITMLLHCITAFSSQNVGCSDSYLRRTPAMMGEFALGRCASRDVEHVLRRVDAAENGEDSMVDYQPDRLFWLHVPKCGSSFGTTLYHYACPKIPVDAVANCTVSQNCREVKTRPHIGGDPGPVGYKKGSINSWYNTAFPQKKYCLTAVQKQFGYHTPCMKGDCPDNAVTVLRKPSQRSISAFHAGLFIPGILHSNKEAMRKVVRTPSEFLKTTEAQACATKMILGHECGYAEKMDKADIEKAKERLLRFKFVGITERWDDSVFLFHAMLGGHPLDVEFVNNRKHYSGNEESPKASAPQSYVSHQSVSINADGVLIADGKEIGPINSKAAEDVWFEEISTPRYTRDGRYNETVLKGVIDEADEEIYNFAYEIFEKNFAIHSAKIEALKAAVGYLG